MTYDLGTLRTVMEMMQMELDHVEHRTSASSSEIYPPSKRGDATNGTATPLHATHDSVTHGAREGTLI